MGKRSMLKNGNSLDIGQHLRQARGIPKHGVILCSAPYFRKTLLL
jgi:hypothetical protein